MRPKLLLLCLALVLSGGWLGDSNIARADENAITSSPPAQLAGQIYRNAKYGFQLILPEGWEARETSISVSHYDYVFLTINNQRPGLAFEGWEGRWVCNNRVTQLQSNETYISVGWAGGPMGVTMRTDTVGEDLRPFLATNQVRVFSSRGVLNYGLDFFKRGQRWSICACMKEPVTKENRRKVMALLQSFRFVDAPVNNASWAESLAWKELPEKLRDTGDWWMGWPSVGQGGQQSGSGMFGQRSVLVTNLGSAYSVKFGLQAIGEWRFMVKTNGEVESEPPTVHAVGPPPSQWPSDLPGVSKGIIDSYWVAPYVQASKASGKTTITWFAADGRAEKQASVNDVNPASGFVEIIGGKNLIEGINEDWRIVPRPFAPGPFGGYATGTPDSRVFLDEFCPEPGKIALDIDIHGKRVNTIGPFFPCYPSADAVLNDDGGAGLLVRKDASKSNPQIIVLNTNGEIRFQADCGPAVWSPIVAPDGAGVLLRPNTGTNQNTFMWFTAAGLQRSLEISPNPEFAGWIPESCQSLFSTSIGLQSGPYELIDWNTGKKVWGIPCPGSGEVLAIALTPKLILFSVAEPYPSGTWHEVNESLLRSGKEWVRTFYAVDVQDGKLVARWRGQFPHRYFDANRDHFLRLGDRLFYVTADEFTELHIEDILVKKDGWQ